MMELILGIDGGGTKTTALLADPHGNVIARATAGGSNYHAIGAEAAFAALDSALRRLLDQHADAELRAVCLGLAGVDRPADRAQVEAWAARALPGVRVTLVNDAELLLAAGTPEGWGVGVIGGTGSIALGRAPDGRSARAGGWGYRLGDEGSGYAVGRAALHAVARAADGRGAPTALTPAILAHWSLPQPDALIQHVYAAHTTRREIAELAEVVVRVAERGDEVAGEIVREAGRELALAAHAVVRQLDLAGSVPCALGGGVLVHAESITRVFFHTATELGLRLEPVQTVSEPALGAVKLAREMLK